MLPRWLKRLAGGGIARKLREDIDDNFKLCLTSIQIVGPDGDWEFEEDGENRVIFMQPIPPEEDDLADGGVPGEGCKETFSEVLVTPEAVLSKGSYDTLNVVDGWAGEAQGQTITFGADDENGNRTLANIGPLEDVAVGDETHFAAATIACRENILLVAGNAIQLIGDVVDDEVLISLAPGLAKGQIAWYTGDENLGWVLGPRPSSTGQVLWWDAEESTTITVTSATDPPQPVDVEGAWRLSDPPSSQLPGENQYLIYNDNLTPRVRWNPRTVCPE